MAGARESLIRMVVAISVEVGSSSVEEPMAQARRAVRVGAKSWNEARGEVEWEYYMEGEGEVVVEPKAQLLENEMAASVDLACDNGTVSSPKCWEEAWTVGKEGDERE
jgi:hypothetical protein